VQVLAASDKARRQAEAASEAPRLQQRQRGTPSPAADSSSPAGSTILDEETAEALSRKDPIAAQVWRMFHKAKNTMPNGARMENLTWRLMSMTLKKRKEDGGSASSAAGSASGSVQSTPGPLAIPTFAELAQQRSAALPTNVSAPSSNAPSPGTEARRAEEEEGRDTVQPLESVGAPSGRARAARERERERLNSYDSRRSEPDAQNVLEHEEEERGRRRRGRGENLSKSTSATPESEDQHEYVASIAHFHILLHTS
jgi:GATA-binding protein